MWILILITMAMLAVCTYSDLKRREISLTIVILFSLAGLLCRGFLGFWWMGITELVLRFVPGFFLLIIVFFRKKDIGAGDAIMILATGYILGCEYNLYMLEIGSLTAGLYGLFMIYFKGQKKNKSLPFAPFLLIGCFGAGIVYWIKNYF